MMRAKEKYPRDISGPSNHDGPQGPMPGLATHRNRVRPGQASSRPTPPACASTRRRLEHACARATQTPAKLQRLHVLRQASRSGWIWRTPINAPDASGKSHPRNVTTLSGKAMPLPVMDLRRHRHTLQTVHLSMRLPCR